MKRNAKRFVPVDHTEKFLLGVLKLVLCLAVVMILAVLVLGCNNRDRNRRTTGDPFWPLMAAFYDNDNTARDERHQRNSLERHAARFEDFLQTRGVRPSHSLPVLVVTERSLKDVPGLCNWPPDSGITGCTYHPRQKDSSKVVVWAGTHNDTPAFFHELAHVNSSRLGIDDEHAHPLWAEIDRRGNELSAKIRAGRDY